MDNIPLFYVYSAACKAFCALACYVITNNMPLLLLLTPNEILKKTENIGKPSSTEYIGVGPLVLPLRNLEFSRTLEGSSSAVSKRILYPKPRIAAF